MKTKIDMGNPITGISEPAKPGSLERVVRAMPRYHHQSGAKQDWKLEYWPGDEQWRNSLHLHWNWMGRGHWLCIFLPEWP